MFVGLPCALTPSLPAASLTSTLATITTTTKHIRTCKCPHICITVLIRMHIHYGRMEVVKLIVMQARVETMVQIMQTNSTETTIMIVVLIVA